MVVIKSVNARPIKDSRGEKTILVSIKTRNGTFSASAPNGKSRGKYETAPYKKDLSGDIKILKQFSSYFSDDEIEKFDDLRRVEDIVDRHIGANTLFALESAVLRHWQKKKEKRYGSLSIQRRGAFQGLSGIVSEGECIPRALPAQGEGNLISRNSC